VFVHRHAVETKVTVRVPSVIEAKITL
jgi:hypothetical protein